MQIKETDLALVQQPPLQVVDRGNVRLGGFSPSLPPVRPTPAIVDGGKVRLGGFSPAL